MLTPEIPPARAVISPDNTKIATYEFGDPDAPTVFAVHGFASSALLNWHSTGWIRDLVRADFHVIAIDQRGHGASDKPHSPDAYTMGALVEDVLAVLDTFMLDEVAYVGYSLGARVGWEAAREQPEDDWATLVPREGPGTRLSLMLVTSDKPARHHMDIFAADQDAEVDRLVRLGARTVEWDYPDLADYVVLEDPDGNRFCVVQA
jgi:pimeloyl-ACP methyl ester carboxylesterase